MNEKSFWRQAQRLAHAKGYIVRKNEGDEGEYTLAFAQGLASAWPPMVFEDLADLMAEIRMR